MMPLIRDYGRIFGLCAVLGAGVALGLRASTNESRSVDSPASTADDSHRDHARPGHVHHEAEPGRNETGSAEELSDPTGVLLDLGNERCPVMGGFSNGKTFTEWQGLRVGHCCPPCSERFLENPEALLDEVAPDWRDAEKAVRMIDASSGQEQENHLAEAAVRWTIVRPPKKEMSVEDPAPVRTGGEEISVLLELGNTQCPVMGGEVDGETFTEWNGLRIGHCCAGCSERFLKNPESLLDEVMPSWKKAAQAARAIDAAEGEERERLMDETARNWTLLRIPVGSPKNESEATSGLLVDVGNEICPVMGHAVDGETFTEWRGLRVSHCCPGCSRRFLQSPESMLDDVAPGWRDLAEAIDRFKSSGAGEKEVALEALRARWTLLRVPTDDN